jgi:hypothetical protein
MHVSDDMDLVTHVIEDEQLREEHHHRVVDSNIIWV